MLRISKPASSLYSTGSFDKTLSVRYSFNDLEAKRIGFINLFNTKSVTKVATNVIMRAKIKIESGEIIFLEYKTKNKIPIKGMWIPIKATNRNLKA